ncbi:MAG: PH domain-containing protein, partial [Aureliella sp.]
MTEQRHKSTDQEAHWLHPSSLVFEFVGGIRSQLIPALLALFGATTGTWLGGLIALLYFVGSMTAVVLRYVTLRYRLVGDELIIDEGVIFHVHRTVPIQRIQNIDVVQNPFHRLLRVAEVRVETASGTEPEAVLRVLSLAEFESLRARIFARKRSYELAQSAASEPAAAPPVILEQLTSAVQPAGQAAQRETIMKISFAQLALAGIASNRGTALLLVGLGFVSQQFSTVARSWRIETAELTRYLPENSSAIVMLALAIAGLLALLTSVKILSIAWYVLKFYDYTLDRSGDALRVSCGLLTRVSATVRRDRIQLISIRRTLIGRWLRIASIRIETAGGGGESDDPTATIARRWFLPVISEAQIPAIMEQLSPGLKWDERA